MTAPEDPFRGGPSGQPAWDAPAAQGPGAPPPGYGPVPQGYGAPPAYGGHVAPVETSSRAIVVLVLAIGSFVVIPLIPAILALVLLPGAREEIDLSGGRLGGTGLLTAAKIVSWVNIGLSIVVLLLLIAAFVLFVAVGFS